MKKKNYDELSKQILENIGGSQNIAFFTHCITRLRFILKDQGLVKMDEIDQLEGVMGCTWAGDQLQIIIGQEVIDLYDVICKVGHLEKEEPVNDELGVVKEKRNPVSVLLDIISSSVVPVLPILVGCGNIKVLCILLNLFGWIDPASSTYKILTFVGDTGFYFLPIFVGAFAAKKMNANQSLGMLMGAILIYPQTAALITGEVTTTVFGLPIYAASYTSTVFPVIITVFVMSYVQKFFGKIAPKSIRMLIESFGTVLIMIPLALCVLAPIGAIVGSYLVAGVMIIINAFGAIGVAIIASLYPILFLFGMNSAIVSYIVNAFSVTGTEPFFIALASVFGISTAISCLVVFINEKDKNKRESAMSTGITAFFGITEPAIFGVISRNKNILFSQMAGLFAGGFVVGLTQTIANAFPAGGGLLGLAVFINNDGLSNMINVIIAMTVASIVTFILGTISYKKIKRTN